MAPGPDPAVLLVHGFASSAEHNWRRPGWLDLLAEAGRETIAVDLLGHGRAPRPSFPGGLRGGGGNTWPRPSATASPSTPSAFPRARRCCCGWPPTSPAGSAAWPCSASAPARSNGATRDPSSPRSRVGDDPDPVNVHGMVFRRLAEGLGNDRAALIAFLRRP